MNWAKYKHYFEDGEWKKESIAEYRDRTQSSEERAEELRRLYRLHQDLNDEMNGWGKVLAQTRERLLAALESNDGHGLEIEHIRGEQDERTTGDAEPLKQ